MHVKEQSSVLEELKEGADVTMECVNRCMEESVKP